MTELSARFAELMARMARSDADLFRTLAEQNTAVRQMVDGVAGAADDRPEPPAAPVLPAAQGLLPEEECELRALKLRFGKLPEAQLWLEERIGKAPKKPTWAVIEQVCRTGAWPTAAKAARGGAGSLTAGVIESQLLALEQRLVQKLEQQLEPRLVRMEQLLAVIAAAVIEDKQGEGSEVVPRH
ncbi:MAG: hypothetical protein VKK62_02755 [Synechococcaceae cyanobacterium]|nr:hypothetical protein [Synechococcaceae cyanobacterium]